MFKTVIGADVKPSSYIRYEEGVLFKKVTLHTEIIQGRHKLVVQNKWFIMLNYKGKYNSTTDYKI